jgi:hypothetical protein
VSARVIQVRLSRNPRGQKQGGWEVYEADGVSPVYCGERGRESALSYARQRADYGRALKWDEKKLNGRTNTKNELRATS